METSGSQLEGTGRTALITGASSGIGKAFAEVCASRGFSVILVARRKERLDEIAGELRARYHVAATSLPADLSDPRAPEHIREQIQEMGIHIDVLVNNAGYSLSGRFSSQPWKAHDMFLNVMITSAVHLCHLFIPGMKARSYGRIINVASFAAFMAGTAGDLYVGAKSFLVKFSQALAVELAGSGIHVTAVCPGFTRSEFHDVMGVRKEADKLPGIFWMDARTVARQGYAAVMKGKAVYINGMLNTFLTLVLLLIPDTVQLCIGRLTLKKSKQ